MYSDIDFMKFLGGRSAKEQVTKSATQYHATHLLKPFLNLNINVPLALKSLEKHIAKEKKNFTYTTTVSVINSLNVKRIQLYLFPDSTHTVLPVILVHGSNNKSLETRVKKAVAIKTMLERMPDGSYRLKKEAVPSEKQNNYPIDLYRIYFSDKGAVIAPKSLLPELKNTEILQQTRVAQMAASVETSQDLAVFAIRIPETFQDGWEEKIKDLPGLEQNAQMAMMAAMGGGILSQMTKPFEKIEAMALGFRLDGETGRTLSYAQIFRKGVDGAKVYQQLNAGDADDADVDGIVWNLMQVFKDPRYQQQIRFNDNRLALEFSWSETDDKDFFSALSEATIGQLMAQGMQLEPTEGPLTTLYTDEPRLDASVNVDKLKKTIPESFRKSIFPGSYFDFGDNPHMTLNLDTVDIPNGTLAELTYDVLAVRTPDGKDVMRPEENQFKFKLNPGSTTPGHITLNIKKGTPAKALGKAKIRFLLFLPSVLEQLEFNVGDAKGSVKKTNGIHVKLGRLEKDVAKVQFRGGKDVRLFAYDKTGRALASQESMSSASSVSTRFQGVIDRLKVVVVKEKFDYPFEIDVDLNEGQELKLSHTPEIPKRVRFNRNPIKNYVKFAKEDLDDLSVQWKEASATSWNDSLSIQLAKGPFSGQVNWEVHFFRKDEPLYLSGNSFWGSNDVSFSLQKGELKKANAAFGSVQLNLASEIHRISYVKKSDGKPVVHRMPSGKKAVVIFNKNAITINAAKTDIIQTMAYDDQGRRLKQDNYTRHKDGKLILYFWGLPEKFEMDLVLQEINKTIHFDIRQRPVDEKAYLEFQVAVENHGEVVKTLKAIALARRKERTGYGDDLAGLHYIYDRKKKRPMKLIDKKIAHSDPAGRNRFGYTLKPYMGYYFTILSGTESNGVKKDYPKQSKKRTYTWHKGTFKTTPYIQTPDIVAIPVDTSQPTFFLQWDQVYMKQLNGSKLEYLHLEYNSQGWLEAKYNES